MSQKEQSSATERVILVVDTAQEDLTVALRRGEAMLAARTEHVGNKHAERVLGLVAEVLEEAGLEKRAIGVVGFGAGPGSFTGLRVACGIAQGLAWALEVPVVALSNLEALAEHTLAEKPLAPGKRIAAVNDARMNECYAAIYEVPAEHAAGERLVCVKAAALLKPEEAEAYLAENGVERLCGSGSVVYADAFKVPEGIEVDDASRACGADFCRLAASDVALGRTMAPEAAAPLYVRDRVALTMAERAAGERL